MPRKSLLSILIFSLPFIILLCSNRSVTNTESDVHYIKEFSKTWNLTANADSIHSSFEAEVQFIRCLQDSVICKIVHTEIPHKYFGDLSYYYNNRKGFCYDRSVLMEKILSYYRFPFRHIYLSFGSGDSKPSLFDLLKKSTTSHALFEVKTVNGWMAVGSNANWIGITPDGKLLTITDVREKLQRGTMALKYKFDNTRVFWKEKGSNFTVVYGLYSRHGDFFNNDKSTTASILSSPGFLPDYNLRMLLDNF